MIPSVIASQVQRGIEDFLRTTYPPEDPFFEHILENFFKEPGNLFKGPYLSLKLPFRPGTGRAAKLYPELPMKFAPYLHQELAFERLSGETPRSTLIATGTGSGKTECFMYPLLDYCYRHRGERGVKAIIIYPMNALATDQARRFAREIYDNPNLKGNVSAGLFIGGQDDSEGVMAMTRDSVITCKDTMRRYPPDILMTNYKMLDFLLLRPKDYPLWQFNGPETLKYVVVDELHTFDGAQGTDLACLLRRLLRRLKTPSGHLCCAGTSATLGSGENGKSKMLSFAGKLFETVFDEKAIITEDMLKPSEFLGDDVLPRVYPIPGVEQSAQLQADNYATEGDYLNAQCQLWFGTDFELPDKPDTATRFALGERLRAHFFFQCLIRILNNQTMEEDGLAKNLDQIIPGFTKQPKVFQTAFIDSIFALISFARRRIVTADGAEIAAPFLQVRVQLWLREMRRMVATVEPNPRLCYAADRRPDDPVQALPLLHCRNCGHVGYLSMMPQTDHALSAELDKIYRNFFAASPTIQYIFHDDQEEEQPEFPKFLCGHCLTLSEGGNVKKCSGCGTDDLLIPVLVKNPRVTNANGNVHVYKNCPFCGGLESLTVLGSRSASLISVVISQLFASQFNDDPKLLAFSDSVQDASHRAGFFSARTYRFNLRAAIQQVLDASGEVLNLETLFPRFVDYWREKLGGDAEFIAQFIPPDLQYRNDYEELIKKRSIPAHSAFFELVCKRIHWEILSEYGYRSRVGRTLEKSGCSIVRLPAAVLEQWAADIHGKLTEEIGALRRLALFQVKQFLTGFIRMIRIRGGIYADYFAAYLKDGNSFGLKKTQPFLPDFGKGRAPVFVTLGRGPSRFDALIGSGSSRTNYQQYLERCWGDVIFYSEEIFREILNSGSALGILHSESGNGYSAWGICPAMLELENEVDQFVCNKTRHAVSAPRSERELWQDMPSSRLDVKNAKFVPQAEKSQDYYGELYRYGRVHRVITGEHTGLLEREDREALEARFINGEGIADPNILSCTPTLEMGINIGDLSSVILCSMPPAQANYVQRIGRAGRRDGNAFNFVVAAGQPHDLHFFAEPKEMIEGEVTPPGIFLNAPAVLERQLTAFCFDRWIESGIRNASLIPAQLRMVIDQVGRRDQKNFPYTFFQFIELHREALRKDFCSIFPDIFTPETAEHLRNFMSDGQDGGLEGRILSRLEFLFKERKELQEKLHAVNGKLKALQARPMDNAVADEMKDLKFEKNALQDTITRMNAKQTFNFFTDEGLLPNYAFPEAGVTLRSVIYRKREAESAVAGKFETFTNEYERSGRSAIQEFAPGNAFYVDGRKLIINRINMTGSTIERWHFCGACNHIEKGVETQHSSTCPKCGSPTWADGNMIRNVLRMTQVVANQPDRESRSYDEKEDREPIFFNKLMLSELSSAYVEKAYKVEDDDFPFGLEFLRKATFREVNFGEQNIFEGDEIEISTRKVSRNGFQVCKECGAVAEKDKSVKHAPSCKYYGKPDSKGIIECLYLYREFESEALRLLLPLDELDIATRLPSFIAALYLGLRERFEGSVDHLQVMIHEEPLPDTSVRKRYLVLYDQIPGGTGYLKQLANTPADFMDMLQKAYDKLQNCSCRHVPDKDGCYSCLYAYRVSHDLPNIKRSEALTLMKRLLSKRDCLAETETIETISINALFDSELEKRFIEALRRSSYHESPVESNRMMVNGKSGYSIVVNGNSYQVEPQVEIGTADGVETPSRADFVIYPMRQSKKNLIPVAIFTDGFQFHADLANGNYRFHKDLAQRMALVKSGRFLCWSLSYQDVMTKFEKDHKNSPWNDVPLPDCGQASCFKETEKQNSLETLISFLANPQQEEWSKFAAAYALACGKRGQADKDAIDAAQHAVLTQSIGESALANLAAKSSGQSYFWEKRITHGTASMRLLSSLSKEDVIAKHIERIKVILRLNDSTDSVLPEDFQVLWNELLQACNILQFLPATIVVTDRYIQDGLHIPETKMNIAEGLNEEWQPLFEVTAPEVHDILTYANQHAWGMPEGRYELPGADNEVIAEAELAWPERNIAVLTTTEFMDSFQARGWQIMVAGASRDFEKLNSLFRQREVK